MNDDKEKEGPAASFMRERSPATATKMVLRHNRAPCLVDGTGLSSLLQMAPGEQKVIRPT